MYNVDFLLSVGDYPDIEIPAVQGDNLTRTVTFQLLGGEPVDLTGCTVRFTAKKPDDTTIYNDCTIKDAKNGVVELTLTGQTLSVSGGVKSMLIVSKAGGRLSSFPFTIRVVRTVLDEDAIISSDEFGALDSALKNVDDCGKQSQEALKETQKLKDEVQNIYDNIPIKNADAEIVNAREGEAQLVTNLQNRYAKRSKYGDTGIKGNLDVLNPESTQTTVSVISDNSWGKLLTVGGKTYIQGSGANKTPDGGEVYISGLNVSQLSNVLLYSKVVDLNNNTMFRATDWAIFRDTDGVAIRNRKTSSQLVLSDDGTILYNGKPLAQITASQGDFESVMESTDWAIRRNSKGKRLDILNKVGTSNLTLWDSGVLSYNGKEVALPQVPKYDQTQTVNARTSKIFTHNLGYQPMAEVSNATLGNVLITWKHRDNNSIEVYNYQPTGTNNEAEVRVRCW